MSKIEGRKAAALLPMRVAALIAALVAAGCAIEPEGDSFYELAAAALSGPAGEILRAEPMTGAPNGASAYRILYRSTGLADEPIAVSGIVVVPQDAPPEGGRPVLAWAHPTTGVATHCAPSLQADPFRDIPGLGGFLDAGYVVAATDYPGLGTEGTHPYLVGLSEGRAVLDSVRAARAVAGADAGKRFAVWGHSQGGQAALFSGQLASAYAPELDLVGVAAAAPATDLRALLRDDIGSPGGKVLASFALWTWARIYHAPLEPVVYPQAVPTVDRIAQDCIETRLQDLVIAEAELPLNHRFLKADVAGTEPWSSLLARNAPGQAPAGAPVFIAQGSADVTVRPQVTRRFVDELCRRGERVELVMLEGVDHDDAGERGAPAASLWIADRFAGRPVPTVCG